MEVPEIHTLDELVKELHKVFDGDCVDVDYVQALLSAYKSNPKEWKKFAIFDPHRYTRNLIDAGNGKFNLMMLCWGESNGSSIHDHHDSHCFVKIMDGKLQETMYDWPSDSSVETAMQKRGVSLYSENEVTYINDDKGLHRMENLSHTDSCVSMHLYCPPFDECKTFDEHTGHEKKCKITFYSQYGKRTPFQCKSQEKP